MRVCIVQRTVVSLVTSHLVRREGFLPQPKLSGDYYMF